MLIGAFSKFFKFVRSEDRFSLTHYKMTVYECVWRAILLLTAVGGAFLLQKMNQFHTSPELAHIPKQNITDFFISIYVAIIIGIIRKLIHYTCSEKVILFLSEKRRKTEEDAKKRSDQLCKWIFDFPYYISTTAFCYYILKDQPFFPQILGGKGDNTINLFPEWPMQYEIPYAKIFYLIQFGNHLYTFIDHLIFKYHDPKYYEYILHHSLALFLIFFSYMTNMMIIGLFVLLLHDPGDVVLITARAYTDYKNRKTWLNVLIYACTYTIWVYTRNYLFPKLCITAGYNFLMQQLINNPVPSLAEQKYIVAYQTLSMSALAIMHAYWTVFLTSAAVNMIIKKGTDKNGYDS